MSCSVVDCKLKDIDFSLDESPLKPLTAKEVSTAVSLIHAYGFESQPVKEYVRIVSIVLKEPSKSLIYKNAPVDREAKAVVFDNKKNTSYDIVLNLSKKEIIACKVAPKGSQPIITIDEMSECEAAVINDPKFKEVLKRLYNIDDTSLVMVDIWSAGNYGSEEDSSRRLTRPLCFLRSDATDNGYAHPLEGVRL